MLLKDYEAAKRLAATSTDDWLKARRARYDKIGTRLTLVGLLGLSLFFFGDGLFARYAPGFGPAWPMSYRLVTVLFPALCVAGFLFSGQFLDRRRGIIDLARRLKSEQGADKEV